MNHVHCRSSYETPSAPARSFHHLSPSKSMRPSYRDSTKRGARRNAAVVRRPTQHGTRGGLCFYFSTTAEQYRVHDRLISLQVSKWSPQSIYCLSHVAHAKQIHHSAFQGPHYPPADRKCHRSGATLIDGNGHARYGHAWRYFSATHVALQ